ncbi:MAG: adenylate/guanylate cyclase domain-containing protein [Pseudomonadota bacterium]
MSDSNAGWLPARLKRARKTIVVVDIRRQIDIGRTLDLEDFALWLDDFYFTCADTLGTGHIIKFLGDACLALYDEDASSDAVERLLALCRRYETLCSSHHVRSHGLRCAVDIGDVVVGEFGPTRQRDVLGHTVMAAFLMQGSDIVISQRVYRQLPNGQRSQWHENYGQESYSLTLEGNGAA